MKLSIGNGCEDNERPHARPQEPLTVDGEAKLPLKGFSDLAERAFQSLQVSSRIRNDVENRCQSPKYENVF